MDWINGFVVTVLCVVIITSLCNTIMPEGNLSKFVNLVLGLVVVITIFGAALGIGDIDFDTMFNIDTMSIDIQDISDKNVNTVSDIFAKNLSENITLHIKQNYDIDVDVEVSVSCDDNGNIIDISEICIKPPLEKDIDDIKMEISKVYGVAIEKIITT